MRKQYNVKITKYALSQMKTIRDYIADELLAPQAAYDLFLEMKKTAASLENTLCGRLLLFYNITFLNLKINILFLNLGRLSHIILKCLNASIIDFSFSRNEPLKNSRLKTSYVLICITSRLL